MRQRALKMAFFTGWALKFEDAKFYFESKASVIDISSIASFKLFLLLGCGNIALFQTVPGLA